MLALVFIAFIGHAVIHIEPSIVALLGAGLLVLISGVDRDDYLGSVEWETLLFFIGLFILVGALVKTGVIGALARLAADVTGGDALTATMLILVVSAVLSGVIDNIPYVATMSPVVADLTATISDPVQAHALWWALAVGADFGGNLTAVGASANVVMLGIASPSRPPHQFLGIHPQGRDRHRTDHRDRGPLPLAALLRIQLTSTRRRAFDWQVRPLSTCRAPRWYDVRPGLRRDGSGRPAGLATARAGTPLRRCARRLTAVGAQAGLDEPVSRVGPRYRAHTVVAVAGLRSRAGSGVGGAARAGGLLLGSNVAVLDERGDLRR